MHRFVPPAFRPDGEKKAYVRLAPDYDALDVANKASISVKSNEAPYFTLSKGALLMSEFRRGQSIARDVKFISVWISVMQSKEPLMLDNTGADVATLLVNIF